MKLLLFAAVVALLGCTAPTAPPSIVREDSMPRLLKEGKVMELRDLVALLAAAKKEGKPLIGYGLSVFEGTKIEKFEFEILDVMKNYVYPRHDLILFRGSHPRWLDNGNVIAGMSGSPCYINGKMIGALSYTMGSFEKVPLGGITPIEYMVREMDRPVETSMGPKTANGDVQQVRTPLCVSGISRRVMKAFEEDFEKHHFVLSGGGSGSSVPQETGPFQPGSAIGANLMNGDYDFTGIGTVTLVDGDRVLAFGHPMFNAGEIEMPITSAIIHTTFTGVARSNKIGSPDKILGALVHDRPHAIYGKVGKQARMIPVTIVIGNPKIKTKETVRVNVLDHPMYMPILVSMAMWNSADAFESSENARIVVSRVEIKLSNGRVAAFEDVASFHPIDGMTGGRSALGRVRALIQNEYEKPVIESISITQETVNENRSASLKHAWPMADEVEDGGKVRIRAVLKQFRGLEKIKDLELQLPRGLRKGTEVTIKVGGGSTLAPERAPASNLAEYINALEKDYRSTSLVAITDLPSYSLQYKGEILSQMPNSALAQLVPTIDETAYLTHTSVRTSTDTDWVVNGTATVTVKIK